MIKYKSTPAESKWEDSSTVYEVRTSNDTPIDKSDALSKIVFYEGQNSNSMTVTLTKGSDIKRVQALLSDMQPAFEVDNASPPRFKAIDVSREQIAAVAKALATNKEEGRNITYAVLNESDFGAILKSELEVSGLAPAKLGFIVEKDAYKTHRGADLFKIEFPKGDYGARVDYIGEISQSTSLEETQATYPLTRIEFGQAPKENVERFMKAAKDANYSFEQKEPKSPNNYINIYGNMADVADLLKKAGFFMPDALKNEIDQKMQTRSGADTFLPRPTREQDQQRLQDLVAKRGQFVLRP